MDNGSTVTVPAGADGTARVSLTPEAFQNDLVVSATYADGHTSASYVYAFMAITYAQRILDHPAVLTVTTTDGGGTR